MLRSSEADKADVKRRMRMPHRQNVARILSGAGHPYDQHMQIEEGLEVAGGSRAGIRERP
jgi:hypothetical protein